jgi:multiple antibiotic resistance protein
MDQTLLLHFAAALFAIMNPLGNLPVYINATVGEDPKAQRYVALFMAVFIAAMLSVFFWFGSGILHFFGVSLPTFRIAGGILLLMSGIGMVGGREGKQVDQLADKVGEQSARQEAEHRFRNLLIPVGVPLFVGPGSISTVILFAGQADTWVTRLPLSLVVPAMAAVVFLFLLMSERVGKLLGPMGLDIATRLMGLILAAIGVQFILSGLGAVTNGFIDAGALQ